jgi:hypothetical protein
VDCPFGFKLHAIKAARDAGFDGVIWLDGGGYLTGPMDRLMEHTESIGHYFIDNPLEPLSRWVSDEALAILGPKREYIRDMGWKLFGGTPYAFDFRHERTRAFFSQWWTAMELGAFRHVAGQHGTEFHGHRHDEAVAAVIAHQMGMEVSPFMEFYVGDEKDTPTSFIRSGHAD